MWPWVRYLSPPFPQYLSLLTHNVKGPGSQQSPSFMPLCKAHPPMWPYQQRHDVESTGIIPVFRWGHWLRCFYLQSKSVVAQLCPTLCDPMDCSPPGSSVHGILQARILEWVAIPFSRGSSQPRDWTQPSLIAGRFFTIWATREALCLQTQC